MPSISAKGSPSISMRSAKVPESPSSALATMNLRRRAASAAVFHLMPVGNPAPPRPRRPDAVTSATVAAGPSSSARASPLSPPCGAIVVERGRIDHAAAGEGEAGLPGEEGNVLRPPQPQRMRPAGQHPGGEQPGQVGRAHRAVGDPPGGASRPRPSAPARTSRASRCAPPRRPAAARPAATRSAPSASAAASRGTKTRLIVALLQRRVERGGIEPAERIAVQHPRGRDGAEAEAEHRLQGHRPVGGGLVPADPEPPAGGIVQRVRAHRLAGLGAAQAQHVPARRAMAELVIETGDAVHLGARQIERRGNHRDRVPGHVAEHVLQGMEDR